MKTLMLAWTAIACTLLFACKKDDKATPTLVVNQSNLQAAAAAGETTFEIKSNTNWKIADLPDWVKATPTEGKGNGTVTVKYLANSGTAERSVTILVNGEGVKQVSVQFTQIGSAPVMLTDKAAFTVKQGGDLDSIVITSNLNWQLTVPAEITWIHARITSGVAGSTKVYFDIDPQVSAETRTGNLELNAVGATIPKVAITITQPPADVEIRAYNNNVKGGEVVTLAGSGFSATPANNKVTINGKVATVSNASFLSLDVIVPMGAGNGPIEVTVGNRKAIAADAFVYQWTWRSNTVAGDGSNTQLFNPFGIAIGPDGALYIAERGNHRIRKVVVQPDGTGIVSTFAGSAQGERGYKDGERTAAQFDSPTDLCFDNDGVLYVADGNHLIRKITPDGQVTTLKDDGGNNIIITSYGMEAYGSGNLLVTTYSSNTAYHIAPDGKMTLIVKSGDNNISFNNLFGAVCSKNGSSLYFADSRNNRIIQATRQSDGTYFPVILAGSSTGQSGNADGTGQQAGFYYPFNVAADELGHLYVADMYNKRLRKIVPLRGGGCEVTTIAGAGAASDINFNDIAGVAVSKDGSAIYVTEWTGHIARRLTLQ